MKLKHSDFLVKNTPIFLPSTTARYRTNSLHLIFSEICHFKGDKIVLKFVLCRTSRLVVLGGIVYINCIPTIACINVSNKVVKISKIVSMASLARLQLKSEFRRAINNPTLLLIDIDVLNFFI